MLKYIFFFTIHSLRTFYQSIFAFRIHLKFLSFLISSKGVVIFLERVNIRPWQPGPPGITASVMREWRQLRTESTMNLRKVYLHKGTVSPASPTSSPIFLTSPAEHFIKANSYYCVYKFGIYFYIKPYKNIVWFHLKIQHS